MEKMEYYTFTTVEISDLKVLTAVYRIALQYDNAMCIRILLYVENV
jgi:hypothetical protein